ncbi:hypothetical protein [Kingella sp. (in: b-proteobacteria)]|nr:hypothetical protein [Kingella sp. (in: b-proteobacteria)]MDO4656502.1 hypothetical protein [Kingella sp. (in: b-proteobacteria)]
MGVFRLPLSCAMRQRQPETMFGEAEIRFSGCLNALGSLKSVAALHS